MRQRRPGPGPAHRPGRRAAPLGPGGRRSPSRPKYGLEPGTLLETAMAWDIYRPAVAGEIDRRRVDAAWSRRACRCRAGRRGRRGRRVAGLPRRASTRRCWPSSARCARPGRPVGLATNATDRLARRPGGARPGRRVRRGDQLLGAEDPQAGAGVLRRAPATLIGQQPQWVLFVDDDDRAVRGARAARPARVPVDRARRSSATCARRWVSDGNRVPCPGVTEAWIEDSLHRMQPGGSRRRLA